MPNATPLPWPADKAIIRTIPILQLLVSLFCFLLTPLVFNYGGATSDPVGSLFWVLLWLCGMLSSTVLLAGKAWARVLALAWSAVLLARLPGNMFSLGWFLVASWALPAYGYLSISASLSLRKLWSEFRQSREFRIGSMGSVLASLVVLLSVAFYLISHSDRAQIVNLSSSDETVRCAAAQSLAEKVPPPAVALPRLSKLLENTSCVRFAEDKLPEYIEAIGGIDPFLEAMKTGNRIARFKAAATLQWMARLYPQRFPEAVSVFTERMTDEDPVVRRRSAVGLGWLYAAAASAAPELEKALDDPDRDVRLVAVDSLNKIRSFEGLKLALKNSHVEVRHSAIEFLAGTPTAELRVSRNTLDVPDEEITEAGRKRLARMWPSVTVTEQLGYGIEAVPLIMCALNDPDDGNAAAAAKALSYQGRLGKLAHLPQSVYVCP